MSGDWWPESEDQELSPWPPSVSPPGPVSSNSLVDMAEAADWSSELAALAPDSAFSLQQQPQIKDAAVKFSADQKFFSYRSYPTSSFVDCDVGCSTVETLSSLSVGWNSLLLECAGAEAMPNTQNSSAAESPRRDDALYSRQFLRSRTIPAEKCMKSSEAEATWELPSVQNRALEASNTASSIHGMRKIHHSQLHYPVAAQADAACSYTSRLRPDSDPWTSITQSLPPHELLYNSAGINSFKQLSSCQRTNSSIDSGGFVAPAYTSNRELHSFSAVNLNTQSSRQLLPAMLSQLLPASTPSRQSNVQAGSTTSSRLLFENSSRGGEFSPFQRLSDVISFTKHGDHHSFAAAAEKKLQPLPLISCNWSLQDAAADHENTEKKRSITSATSTSSESTSDPYSKKPKLEPYSPSLPFKVRKEKLGEKITALQQLVSPFGKTDTASVLMEAISYIKFLHDQLQVLSKPYMTSISMSSRQHMQGGKISWDSEKAKAKVEGEGEGEQPKQDLRSRGLCLVPFSSTQQVANDNGADYWAAAAIGGSSR